MSGVMVLNTDDTPLHTVSVKHAIGMLMRQVAIIEEAIADRSFGPYPVPLVLRLVRYVKTNFLYGRAPAWSKRAVLRRDAGLCAYCGGPGTTIDHLLPVSRGGANTWRNTVCACTDCNRRKADKTPEEAGLTLRFTPRVPSWRDVAPRR